MMFENLHRVMTHPGDTLKIKCMRVECGHLRAWTREEAIAIYGPDAAPYDITSKSKCGVCGERTMIKAYI